MKSNQRKKEKRPSYSPSEVDLFLKRTPDYDSNLAQMISDFLVLDVSKVIIKYSHENPIQDLYDQVMRTL